MKKTETREVAADLKLNVANKPDSQDICFVPNGDYASVIRKYKPQSFLKGDILDTKGKIIGKHDGIINFTIGQRKGIKISHKEPLYVVNINAEKNEVTVATKTHLAIKKIYLKNINFLSNLKSENEDLFIKVRSTGKLLKAKINLQKSGAEVNLKEIETGISPAGQQVLAAPINYIEMIKE